MTELAGLAQLPDLVEHLLREVRRQRRGHLVEEQDVGLDRKGSRQVEHADHRQGEVTDHLVDIQVVDAESLDPVPHPVLRASGSGAGWRAHRGRG